MKSRFLSIILLFSFVAVFFIMGKLCAQSYERATWVWSNTDEIIEDFVNDDPVSMSWDDFISFCEAPHGDPNDRIVNIYMSPYEYMISNPEKMRAFLADMNSRGFNVYVVLADPAFAIPAKSVEFTTKIDDIMVFQKRGYSNERFAGIMLDIEPHLNNVEGEGLNFYNPDHFNTLWNAYQALLIYCDQQIMEYNAQYSPDMTFSDAVAYWYSDSVDRDNDGVNEILMNDVMDYVSFYTVQAYRDTAAGVNGIQDVAKEEIMAAANAGKVCVVGVETMNVLPESITFHEEGHEALETALDTLYSTYYDNDAGFSSFYIHSYANGNIGEEGYQNLAPPIDDHAPLITITSPNGVQIEGIGFTSDITVTWEAFIPDSSKSYDVELAYTFESQLDNESSWNVIDSDSNVSSAVTQSSSTFYVSGVSTTNTDRIILRAKISYSPASGVPLTTYDKSDFGIAINESPDANIWGTDIYLDTYAYPQGLKVISDNNNVLHSAYYYFHDSGSELPGVYYARSLDGGGNWQSEFIAPASGYDDGYGNYQTTYPRRPSMSKYDDTIAVAWVENIERDNSGTMTEEVISLQINDNDGNPDNWFDSEIYVAYEEGGLLTNVEVYVDSNEDVHVIWESYVSYISSINYKKYTYNTGTGQWDAGTEEVITSDDSGHYFFRSPAITSTTYGLHAIWGEYKNQTIETTVGAVVFQEPFDASYIPYTISNPPPTSIWAPYGAGPFNGSSAGERTILVTDSYGTYLRMEKPDYTDRCGLSHDDTQRWYPGKNLANGTISFKIKTNLAAAVPNVINIVIRATTTNAGNPDFEVVFEIPANQRLDLPAATTGWVIYEIPISTVSLPRESGWAIPNFANVKEIELNIEYTGAGFIDIDEFKGNQPGTIVQIDPAMRIVSSTKSTDWEAEKEVFSQSYSLDQNYGGSTSYLSYPLYFPKIVALGDYVYATWQVTTLGTPGADLLDQYSSVYFSKCDVSSSSNEWDDPSSPLAASGYTPSISVWNNSGTPTVQLVYSNNFAPVIAGELYTGDLLYRETVNGGSTWSDVTYLVSGSGDKNGIRRPYWSHPSLGHRAIQFLAPPFIYSDENGVSTVNWVNGGENGSGEETNVAEEFCKIRGTIFLPPPAPPFADLSDNDGNIIKWSPPNISYAPTSYKLRRIPDNDPESVYYVNGGNPIYGLSYHDNEGIVSGVHYRYELAYLVESTVSGWSSGSNAVKTDIYLLLDDFELDGSGESYTGSGFYTFTDDIVGVRTTDDAYSGTHSYKITYTHQEGSGSFLDIIFPATMDFSGYGSLDMQIKYNPLPNKVERIIILVLVDASGKEYQVGSEIMLQNDGQWHLHHQFLDQTNKDLNISQITKMRFVTWEVTQQPLQQGDTSFFVDDIKLNNNPIVLISEDSLTCSNLFYQRGYEQGFVLNDPNDPINLIFGNGKVPWYLRIYTESQIEDNSSDQYDVLKDGLIRYDADNDTFFPEYNLPLKVWCSNFGPPGFLDSTTNEVVHPEYAVNGYPPITNRYFFRGYDFNKDRKIAGLLTSSEGPFIESENEGDNFYPFDLDGDGFFEGDDFFAEITDRVVLNEEPAWLFVPVKKHPTLEMDNDAIIMDPADDTTWRMLTDYLKGAGKHVVEMYFSVFFGLNQIETMVNSQEQTGHHNGYGEYRGKIIVDMLFN